MSKRGLYYALVCQQENQHKEKIIDITEVTHTKNGNHQSIKESEQEQQQEGLNNE